MFCTNCGKELKADTQFCTHCGAAIARNDTAPSDTTPDTTVDATVDESGQSATDSPTDSTQENAEDNVAPSKPKKKKRWLFLAIAAVVVVAFIAVLVIGGVVSNSTPTAAFGSSDPVSVARTARIVPTSSDGTPLEHYYVRILSATDENGEEIDSEDLPIQTEITGDSGFQMQDVAPGQSSGTYILEIDDGTEVKTTPPLVIDDDEGIAEVLQITSDQQTEDSSTDTSADEATNDETKGADALYLEKLEELQDTYGEAEVDTLELPDYNMTEASLYGLIYAELIDFGDGVERLVTMWNIQQSNSTNDTDDSSTLSAHDARIEVWEYDEENDEVVAILGDGNGIPVPDSTVSYSSIAFCSLSNGDSVLRLTSDEYDDSSDTLTQSYYGLDDEDGFGAVWVEETITPYEGDPSYSINGETMDYDDFSDAHEEMFGEDFQEFNTEVDRMIFFRFWGSSEDIAVNGYDESTLVEYLYVSDTKQTVSETLETLQERMSDDDDVSNADSTSQTSSITNISVEEVVTLEEIPTYYSGYDESDGTAEYQWSYLALSAEGADDDIINSINAELKTTYDTTLEETTQNSPADIDSSCLEYHSALTYASEGIVGVRVEQYRTLWGVHGWTEILGTIYDLETGDELEAWEFAGVSKSELDDAAVEAIVSYVSANPEYDEQYANEAEIRDDAEYLVASDTCTYLLTEEGVTIWLPDYSMGYSYAQGTLELLVIANAGYEDLVGTTNLRSEYILM